MGRWFAEHDIAADTFTLILNFSDADAASRLDWALTQEIRATSFHPFVDPKVVYTFTRFRMNGIAVRVESPLHGPAADA